MRKDLACPPDYRRIARDSAVEMRTSLYRDVHIPSKIDTARIARQLGMGQREFARRFHIPLDMLQLWESGRQVPDDAMKAYIMEIDRHPNAVLSTLT